MNSANSTRQGLRATPFRDWSISRKIEGAIIAAAVVVVVGTGIFFVLFEARKERAEFVTRMTVLTDIIAANSAGPVAFRDHEAAAALLTSTLAEPTVVAAAIFLDEGPSLASLGDKSLIPANIRDHEDGNCVDNGYLCIADSVVLDGKRIGRVMIRCHFREAKASLVRYVSITLAVMTFAVLVAVLIARRLRKLVAGSLLDLSQTAARVSETGDFSIRAKQSGKDEVGMLVESFNGMLHQVQRSDRQLRSNLHFLGTLLDTIPMPVFVQDAGGRLQRFNQIFTRELVWQRPEDILGCTPAELDSPWPTDACEVLAANSARARAQGIVSTYDIALPDAGGERREFIASTAPFSDAEDRPAGIVTILLDMTERNQTLEALRKSESKFRSIFQGTSAAMMVFDMTGRCIECNVRTRELFCATADHALHGLLELNPRLKLEIDAILAGSPTSEYSEMLLVTLDNTAFWGSVSLGLMTNAQGEPEAVTCLVVDVTERRRLESDLIIAQTREQRRIAQDIHDGLGQILAAMAFKSRTVMRLVAGESEATQEEAKGLADLSNQAMEQARALAHGIDPVDLTEHGLPEALSKLADNTTEAYEVDCSYMGPVSVRLPGDHAGPHLYRIVQEAVRNAIWHGKAQVVRIELSGDDGGISLSIVDNGGGFDPHAATAGGMGLRSITYRARMMNGHAAMERRPGGGMKLTVVIPRASP